MQYSELQCRTHYSFLRGASSPQELMEKAAHLGLSALAIVDRNGVYGIPRAYEASRQHPNLKFIVGAELTLGWGTEQRPIHLSLLATDRKGYGTICRLLTASHDGREKGHACLAWNKFLELMDSLSTRGILAYANEGPEEIFGYYRERFEDRFYIPLLRAMDGQDVSRTELALRRSKKLGSKIIAVNDVHYHESGRRRLQDVLTAIREGKRLIEGGFDFFSNAERTLKSPKQMEKLFCDLPSAVENTLEVSERCHFSPSELRYRYPSEWIPKGETAQSYLEGLTWQGARGRYPDGIPEDVRRQLEHEFRLIRELHFADYFLTIWEIVDFARSRGILCQGRGSAANSAVCYCLGITAIDPVRMKLLFERFISAERGEPPDIDVDFENGRREEVIQHIYQKYGRDRAAMVAAVITYRSRSARGEISKALEGSPSLPECLPRLMEEIYGFPRHLSIHSGGFTLSADPIIETVPVEPARMEGRTIIQWDKEDLAIIGLLKVDVLALGMLTALSKTFRLIESSEKLSIATIPPNDPKTYEMLRQGDTVGVFQIESRAQMNMLHRLCPRTFYDLVVEVAIVRPGPIVGKMVHPYLRRRRGREPILYPDPRLEPILGKTLGVPLFQEQVMKIAMVLADFTPGEADELRRSIGAWRSSGGIEKVGKRLKEGLRRSRLPEEFIERIFQQIRGFAEYGFPESHAASFALIAYASAYLKCHYPAEFVCALLNSQPMGFYSSHTLVEDAKRHGVEVLPIDPNRSGWDCAMEGGAVRLGWRVIYGIQREEVEATVAAKEIRMFQSLEDFNHRSGLRMRTLFSAAMSGVFSCFGMERREALWRLLALNQTVSERQMGFCFAASGSGGGFCEMSLWEKIQSDYEAQGLSLEGHPMKALRESIHGGWTARRVREVPHGKRVSLGGLVIARQRPQTGRGTVFAALEDETGFVDLLLRKDFFEQWGEVFVSEPFLEVSGKIQRDRGAVQIVVDRVKPLELPEEGIRVESRDFR